MDESLIGNILGGLINRDGDNNNCMGNGGWWIILLMIFFWGGNGFGGWGNAGAQAAMANYATQADITNGFNFNQLQNDIRGVERGLCDTGYENARLINGATNTIVGQGQRLGEAIAQVGFNVQQCCCDTSRNIDSVRYEMSKNTCDITTNATANTQKILDRLCQMEANAKDNTIAQLRSDLQAAQLTLGNHAQTQSLIGALRPTPQPAYIVSNPYATGYNAGTTII